MKLELDVPDGAWHKIVRSRRDDEVAAFKALEEALTHLFQTKVSYKVLTE